MKEWTNLVGADDSADGRYHDDSPTSYCSSLPENPCPESATHHPVYSRFSITPSIFRVALAAMVVSIDLLVPCNNKQLHMLPSTYPQIEPSPTD